ncbi:MAG: hypothetical protein K5785_00890 [Nitrosarchaeum sp.]|nr:hypothetical protein [Nitrosarchaeum sp.]
MSAPTLVFCSDCEKVVPQTEEECDCKICKNLSTPEIFKRCGICDSLNVTPNTGIGLDGNPQ